MCRIAIAMHEMCVYNEETIVQERERLVVVDCGLQRRMFHELLLGLGTYIILSTDILQYGLCVLVF